MSGLSDHDRRRWLYEQLRSAVEHLASSADDQLAYLEGLGSSELADELALELDDVRDAVIAEGVLTGEQEALLRRLDDQLESMSGAEQSAIWRAQALRADEKWTEVRRRAWALLRSLVDDAPTSRL
jgi:hypothetical protein